MTPSFDNSFVRDLPADPDHSNRRRQVHNACFSRVSPTPVSGPKLVAHSREVAEMLGLSVDAIREPRFAEVFAGNESWDGMSHYAACYGGHQFGNWAGQLGDGRAIGLGEILNNDGARWELQLKGAGPTPYSRTADGRAVLRSSVREFLCSEAMHHLGVPTTRALSLVTTGDQVVRDMFYDGNPKPEPGAIVCRVAPTFIRFGNFEIFAAREETDVLETLADYTIRTHFPELGDPSKDTYLAWLAEVARRTAVMIAHWMRVGFVHGVMNTDNMSILGLTIDYGPYGWLDDFDPNWTPNTTDAAGRRYRYGHQPNIAMWNLVRLANAIYPLVGEADPIEAALRSYPETFEAEYRKAMTAKLGLASFRPDEDDALIADLFGVLQAAETDMTIFYRRLATLDPTRVGDLDPEARIAPLRDAYYRPEQLAGDAVSKISAWLGRYARRVSHDALDPRERAASMNQANPKYVLRNYLAQLAIDKAEAGDPSMTRELLEVMRRPYDEQPEYDTYAQKRPDWARTRPGCSALSCSS
ncbi:MAG: YdiU family protein [Myxococcota bacterium]